MTYRLSRQQYDPLANLIEPHITLVFPFDDETIRLDDLKAIMDETINGQQSFKVSFQGYCAVDDYIFLEMKNGQNIIRKLHDALYGETKFSKHLHPTIPYQPYIRVGRVESVEQAKQIADMLNEEQISFETHVDFISVEEIGSNDESIIIYQKSLKYGFLILLPYIFLKNYNFLEINLCLCYTRIIKKKDRNHATRIIT